MMFFKIAWRNIWRNRRRTFITIASIFFAVILATLMRSLLEGVYNNMIHNIAAFSTGYIQVHKKGYWQEKNIENVMNADSNVLKLVSSTKNVTAVVPRIETFALASTGRQTSGVICMGVDVEKENDITKLRSKIVSGTFFTAKDEAVLIGERLAQKLDLKAGDSIVIMSQGYHAASANNIYRVKGIVQLGSPDLDKAIVYLPLHTAQQLLSLDNQVTGLSIMLNSSRNMNEVLHSLQQQIDTSRYEVMTWKQMMPQLDQMIEADGGSHKIILAVLYLVISFGVFSTVLMMLAERKHEFGIMIAIGLKKHQLTQVIIIETLLILFMGILFGTLAAWPVLEYVSAHPIRIGGELKKIYENYGLEAIFPMSKSFIVFWSQVKAVAIIGLAVTIYPIVHISRFALMKALRS